jgi:hypothetical protein
MRRVRWLAPTGHPHPVDPRRGDVAGGEGNRACGPSTPTGCAPEPLAAGVVADLLSGATGDYGDADDSRSRVLLANSAFGVWAPTYAGSGAYAAEALRRSRGNVCLARPSVGVVLPPSACDPAGPPGGYRADARRAISESGLVTKCTFPVLLRRNVRTVTQAEFIAV